MALQDFAKGFVFLDGNALAKITSIERVTNSGQQRVDLLNEGLAGFTPGSGDITATIGFAIPIGGTEDEFQKKCVQGAYVELQIGFGPEATVASGKIMTVSESQSTGGSTEGSFEWVGQIVEQQ